MSRINHDRRPTDQEYAYLAKHVYTLKDTTLEVGSTFSTPFRTWQIYFISCRSNCGYFGVVYLCKEIKHFVIAHRGTNSARDLIEDYVGVYKNRCSRQKRAAFRLVDLIVHKIRKSPDYSDYTISCTGHSLGAFLAELSVYFSVMILKHERIHAVTFESPGSLQSMRTIANCWDPENSEDFPISTLRNYISNAYRRVKQNAVSEETASVSSFTSYCSCSSTFSGASVTSKEFRSAVNSLDIVSYLCYPNLVNTTNSHAGTIYAINVSLDQRKVMLPFRLISSHHMDLILEWFDRKDAPGQTRLVMADWPTTIWESQAFFKYAEYSKAGKAISLESLVDKRKSRQRFSEWLHKEKKKILLKAEGNFHVMKGLTKHNVLPLRNCDEGFRNFLQGFWEKRKAILENIFEEDDTDFIKNLLLENWCKFGMPLAIGEELLAFEVEYNKRFEQELICKKMEDVHTFRQNLTKWLDKTGFTIEDHFNEEIIREEVNRMKSNKRF